MVDEIVKVDVQETGIVKPLDLLKNANETFVAVAQNLSALLQADLSPLEMALIHDWTSKKQDDIKDFDSLLQERILDYVKSNGKQVTEAGTLEVGLGDGRFQRITPTTTKPNDKLTERKLKSKGIPLDEGMDKSVKMIVNETKLAKLLADKKLSKEDYEECFAERSYRVGSTIIRDEE